MPCHVKCQHLVNIVANVTLADTSMIVSVSFSWVCKHAFMTGDMDRDVTTRRCSLFQLGDSCVCSTVIHKFAKVCRGWRVLEIILHIKSRFPPQDSGAVNETVYV